MTDAGHKIDTSERPIGSRAFSGVIWSLIDRGATQIVGFIATVIMARLLTPADYGLIGLLLIFVEVGEALASAGVTQALVASGMEDRTEQHTGLLFNLIAGGIIYIILWFIAPGIADFYGEPQLIWLTRVVGLCVPLKACTCLSEARIMYAIAFRKRAVAVLLALLCAGVMGIWGAATGLGVKAIALYMVMQAALTLLFLSIAAHGGTSPAVANKPQPVLAIIRRLWKYGIRLTGARLADVACNNSYLILIGRLFPVADVGFFTRGRQFASVPAISMSEIVKRVSYPVLCRQSAHPSLQNSSSLKMMKLSMAVATPIMLTLAALSEPVVETVLGEKWILTAPIMTWLCLGMMWTPLDGINLTLILASGRIGGVLKIELIRKIIALSGLLVSFRFGMTGICIGFAISGFIAMTVTTAYAHHSSYGIFRQEGPFLFKIILASVLASLAGACVSITLDTAWLQLLSGVIVSTAVYIIIARFWKITELSEIIQRFRMFLNGGNENKI